MYLCTQACMPYEQPQLNVSELVSERPIEKASKGMNDNLRTASQSVASEILSHASQQHFYLSALCELTTCIHSKNNSIDC